MGKNSHYCNSTCQKGYARKKGKLVNQGYLEKDAPTEDQLDRDWEIYGQED